MRFKEGIIRCLTTNHTALLYGMIAFCLFCLSPGALQARTIISARSGNFTSSTTWTGGIVPGTTDTVIINHTVSLGGSFTVGSSGQGFLKINSGGTLNGTGTINLERGFSMTNNGTLSLQTLNFYASTNDPASTFLNTGTATLSSALSLWANTSVLNNQGTLTINGNFNLAGTGYNSGAMTVNGSVMFNSGAQFTESGYGTFISTGGMDLNGAKVYLSTAHTSMTIGGSVNLNGSPQSLVSNYGSFTLNKSSATFTINDGKLYNYSTGVFNDKGSMTMNSGSGNNDIENYNDFTIGQTLLTYGYSVINNFDSLIVQQDLTNGSHLKNDSSAYMEVDHNLTNSSNAVLNNNGFIIVMNNFLNDWSGTFTGNGGQMQVQKVSTNNGTVSGTMNVCDQSNSGQVFDQNNGSVNNTVTNCAPLPVKLISFEAIHRPAYVLLKWATATEIVNDYFEIQKSTDGRNFTAIDREKGYGTTLLIHNYTYADSSATEGTTYYRLKQVDFNGTFAYSPTVTVRLKAMNKYTDITLYPNPAAGAQEVQLKFFAAQAAPAQVCLVDMQGRPSKSLSLQTLAGENELGIPLYNLAPGMYTVYVKTADSFYAAKFQIVK